MRVLQVSCACEPFHGGGVAVLIDRLSREMIARGRQVMVFTHGHDPRRPRNALLHRPMPHYPVAAINQPEPDFFGRYRTEDYLNAAAHEAFRSVLQSFRPEVVHFHAIQGLGAGLFDLVPPDVPIVLTMHDFWWVCPNLFLVRLDEVLCNLRRAEPARCVSCLSSLPRIGGGVRFELPQLHHRTQYLSRQLRRVHRVLAVSRFLRDRLAGFLPDVQIDVVQNGIDIDPAQAEALRQRRMQSRPAASRSLRFGFVGGLNRYKGFECLAEAVRLVHDDGLIVEVHGCPGAWKKRLAQAAPWLRTIYRTLRMRPADPGLPRLDRRIRLMPSFDSARLADVFASFDALLVPSIVHESFSLVSREALAVGVPVIASRCGGPEEIVRDGHNGLLFEANQPTELAACISRCVREPGLMATLTANAHDEGIRTIARQAEDLLAVYDDARMST